MSETEQRRRAPDADHVLRGENVTKVYNKGDPNKAEVRALEDVSFTVDENEFVVLLGPSGCGKTTLLRAIAGLVEPDGGTLAVHEEPVDGPDISRPMVFQHFNLFPWRTVIENVWFGLEMTGVGKEERRDVAQRHIDLVGLEGFENHYPKELSGGMQQRVGLARALSVDPEILLMDEPFGALDAQTRERMQLELLEIWEKERKTIVFVTHDIDEALLLADRILVMGIEPRNVKTEIEVGFERPRYDRELETDPEFTELKHDIWDILDQQTADEETP